MSPSSSGSVLGGAIAWARRNLFGSVWNTALTLVMLAVIGFTVQALVRWALLDATFAGMTRRDCTGAGACWAFIRVRIDLFFYGAYPAPERWRVHLALALLLVAGIAASRSEGRARLVLGACLVTIVPVLVGLLMVGGFAGLTYVSTNAWGGLMLNVMLTLVASVGGFLIGVLLAFGRRSDLPAVRWLAIVFIDFWRGIPLLTALFMALMLTPLFLPNGVTVDNLVRAMIALTLFTSAYMAETIRGGLQALPRGQGEAAASLGLPDLAIKLLILLPQALRLVIPGLVNIVIDLFKDTTLVSIVGLFDLLGVVNQAARDQAWLGMGREGYAFAAGVFFLCCLAMSLASRRLERRLATGVRTAAREGQGRTRADARGGAAGALMISELGPATPDPPGRSDRRAARRARPG